MSELLPKRAGSVSIAVCGDPGAGKSVFVACVFKTIAAALPDHLRFEFDRETVGNANRFQEIEDLLIREGKTRQTTTRMTFPLRLFIRPHNPPPGNVPTELTVNLLDFAGGHFRALADMRPPEGDAVTENSRTLREVDAALAAADAFVILINSRDVEPPEAAPAADPFNASVEYIRAHCRQFRKPLALVFSQIDRVPRLTDEAVRGLPRVQDFQRQFTEDLQSSVRDRTPFGIVRRLTCYEAVPGGTKPIRQPGSTSIWRPDATQVVFELLRALIPKIDQIHYREDAIREGNARKTKQDEQRAKKRRRIAWVGGLLAGLATLGVLIALAIESRKHDEAILLQDVATRLREAKIASITPDTEAGMARILATDRGDPERTTAELQTAIGDLEQAMNQAADRLVGAPSVGAPYPAELSRFLSLIPHFDPGSNAQLRYVLPQLEARRRFLSDWLRVAKDKERRARTRFLDESAKRFQSAGDAPFVASLRAESTKQKRTEAVDWQSKIDADREIDVRIATMQRLWSETVAEQDPELTQLAREYFAEQLIAAFLKQQENELFRETLLAKLTPDLAKLEDGQIRFDVFARGLLACADEKQCKEHEANVKDAATEIGTKVAERARSSENLLRSLLTGALPEERTRLWASVVNALWSSYLFHSQGDSWPADMRPLARTIDPETELPADRTDELLQRIAAHPVYENELLYLSGHLGAMNASRQAVQIYASLLSGLTESGVLETSPLTALTENVSSTLAGRSDPGPLGAVRTELTGILNLARAFNYGRENAQSTSQIEGQLRETLWNATHARCEVLALHTPPSECADGM